MREIKFRGKNKDGWYYGLLTYMFSSYAISHVEDENIVDLIDQETVGQYTGLKDKKGVEIYEGDVLEIVCNFPFRKETILDVVEFDESLFMYSCSDWALYELNNNEGKQYFKIVGNIYDNPELLEVAK